MNESMKTRLGITEDKPTDWFETLYSHSNQEGEGVPWANMAPHPVFKDWIDKNPQTGNGKKALVVGCGLGDDAIELEASGFQVTAFDVSKSAIELCKKRFPDSTIEFVQADLIKEIPSWKNQFDFVLEIFTIQALPPKYEDIVIKNISDFVANDGRLVVVTETQDAQRDFEYGPPWLLNRSYINSFENQNLSLIEQNKYKGTIAKECHLSIFRR